RVALVGDALRGDDVFGLRVIERAGLVVRAPFAPVLVFLRGLLEILSRRFAHGHWLACLCLLVGGRLASRACSPERRVDDSISARHRRKTWEEDAMRAIGLWARLYAFCAIRSSRHCLRDRAKQRTPIRFARSASSCRSLPAGLPT